MKEVVNFYKSRFYLDTKALSLMRIGLGFVILLDLFERSRFLTQHYTDFGYLFRSQVNGFSLFSISGSIWFAALLFIFEAIFAVCLIVGFKTRIATIFSWILLFSLQNRNPFILYGVDDLLRMALFWSIFLPLGRYWSLDSRILKKDQEKRIVSVAAAALIIQICCIYFFSGYFKLTNPLWINFSALSYILQVKQITTQLGQNFIAYTFLLQFATCTTLILELSSAVFIFVGGKARNGVVLLLISMHISFILFLHVGIFPLTSIVLLIGLLGFDKQTFLQQQKISVVNSRQVLLVLLVALSLLANLKSVINSSITKPFDIFISTLGFNQSWQMFSLNIKIDGWNAIEGRRVDGMSIDLLRGGERANGNEPKSIESVYGSTRQKLFLIKSIRAGAQIQKQIADFECNKWNRSHAEKERIENISFIFFVKNIHFNKQTDVKKLVYGSQECLN